MKLTLPFLIVVLALASSTYGQEFTRLHPRCHPGDEKSTHPGGGSGSTHSTVGVGSSHVCGSSAVAGLLGLNLLNCANIDFLSNESKREIGDFTNHYDPLLEEMKKQAGFKDMCSDPNLETLKKDGLLDCVNKVFNVKPGYKACKEVCTSRAGGLLAAVNALNCADVSILSNVQKQCPRGTTLELPKSANHEVMRKRELAEKTTDEIEALVVPLLRRQLASRACERANEELGVRMLNCHSPKLESRLVGGAGAQNSELKSDHHPTTGSSDVCTNTVAGLLALNVLNCADVRILSNESRSQRDSVAAHSRALSSKKRLAS